MNVYSQMYQYFGCYHRQAALESCGILMWDWNQKYIQPIEVPNRHPEPQYDFRIMKEDVGVIRNAYPMPIVGIWHTHIEDDNVNPSDNDLINFRKLTVPWPRRHWYGLVVHTRTRTLTFYNGGGVLYRRHLVRADDGTFMAKYGPGRTD